MERKEFLKLGCCGLVALASGSAGAEGPTCEGNLSFLHNFLSELMESIEREPEEATKIRLLSGCGKACFKRYKFKTDIAEKGKGNVDRMVEALKANFEAWRENDTVHVRYGAVNKNGCYCPAANYRPAKANDIHCYCTRAMHAAMWEAAMGRPIKVDIVQTVRRGDPTCHFLVHLT